MSLKKLLRKLLPMRAKEILAAAHKTRVLVVGDVMLDQFIWGGVSRISPEAPVPVVDFARESFMPGGAANVARNLVSLRNAGGTFRRRSARTTRRASCKNFWANKISAAPASSQNGQRGTPASRRASSRTSSRSCALTARRAARSTRKPTAKLLAAIQNQSRRRRRRHRR